LLVRVIAEVGYKELVCNVHTLLRKHINEPASVQLRGKWANFDPSTWHERTKMKVNVGLGFNNPQQKIQLLMSVLGLQKEAMAQGLSDAPKIYNTLERLVEAGGIGNVSAYFVDPSEPVTDPKTGQQKPWTPPPPQPDPNMILAQAQAKALESEQGRKGEEAKAKAANDQQLAHAKLQEAMGKLEQGAEQLSIERERMKMSATEFDAKYEIDSATGLAKVREVHANVELKEAQTRKTLAEADAEEAETSEVVNLAQQIVNERAQDAEGQS
jgi:hypothetical protein